MRVLNRCAMVRHDSAEHKVSVAVLFLKNRKAVILMYMCHT